MGLFSKSVGSGVFCELGKSLMDFRSYCSKTSYKSISGWIVVEQDVLPGMGNRKCAHSRAVSILIL